MVNSVLGRALRCGLRPLVVVLTLGLATSALAVLTTASAGAAGAGTAVTSMSNETYEQMVQRHINRVRAAHGLRGLRFNSCTDGTAERWALQLASTGRLVHQSPGNILSTCNARYASETLGKGSFSPRGLVRAWMHSSAHRPLLLSRNARRIGIGTYLSGGQWVTAANFTKL